MDNVLIINELYSRLLSLARDSRFGLESLRCDWGSSNSREYGSKLACFRRGMRELAMSSPIKWYKGSYYMFNGKIYEVVNVDVISIAYERMIEDLSITAAINRLGLMDDIFLKPIRMCNLLVPSFDIVAFSNGVVDFSRGLVNPRPMPFSPEYHVIYYHPYEFDLGAKCPRWLNFIHEVLPDKTSRMILQMFLGLGLVQRGTAYNQYEGRESNKVELCLLLIGSGANGKSVIFDVACQLFGNDRISKMTYGDLTADGDEGMRGRFPIRNMIFNWSSDSDPKDFGKARTTGMFKRLVSGEPVPMRELGKNVLESNTIPYLIFNLNELPFPEDATFGFIRRLQYVSFDVTIPKDRQDPELASKIISKELSGVFNWVFRGMQELRRRKFRFPSARGSRLQLVKSLLAAHPAMAWMKCYGLRGSAEANGEIYVWIRANTLYESLVRFCKENDVDEKKIPSKQMFGRIMWDKCSFMRRRCNTGVEYKVYGATEADIKESVIIGTMDDVGECDECVDSFIKDDID